MQKSKMQKPKMQKPLRKLACVSLAALSLLPLSVSPAIASVVGVPVPRGTQVGQTLRWNGTSWVISGMFADDTTAYVPNQFSVGNNNPNRILGGGPTVVVSGTQGTGINVRDNGGGFAAFLASGSYEGDMILQHTGAPSNQKTFYFRVRNSVFDIINLTDSFGIGNYCYSTRYDGRSTWGLGAANVSTFPGVVTVGSNSNAAPNLYLSAASGQTQNVVEVHNSANALLLSVSPAGAVNAAGYQAGGTAGYTGNIPSTAQNTHYRGGLVIGYTAADGSTVGQ